MGLVSICILYQQLTDLAVPYLLVQFHIQRLEYKVQQYNL